jgi:two-component system sensor histidine kinase CpxA
VLSYLNPLRSLFGRIFLWFWLATIVMIVALSFLNRQLSDNFEISAASPEQQQIIAKITKRIFRSASSSYSPDRESLSRMIRNPRLTRDKLIILVRPKSHRLISSKPLPPFMRGTDLLPLALAEQSSQMQTPTHTFFGRATITLNDKTFLLIVGEPKPFKTPMERFQSQDPSIRIAIAALISGLFCFMLAWSLIKPIRQLRAASQRLAEGDTKAHVEGADKRSDELGQLSRDFNQMAERIDQLLGAEKRLLGDISHELRTPLTRLQLAVGLARESAAQDTPKHLQRIETEAERIDDMIAQVLQLSRLESQPERINKELVNINSLLDALVLDAKFEAQTLNKSLNYRSDDCGELNLDPQLIASAVENIVRNAIKYTAEKSSVDVELISTSEFVQIVVNDNGEGVPEDELVNLFRPFYRVSKSRQRQSGGTGLGLAIAERAIKAHQGEIFAENRAEGGLSVTIKIPKTKT